MWMWTEEKKWKNVEWICEQHRSEPLAHSNNGENEQKKNGKIPTDRMVLSIFSFKNLYYEKSSNQAKRQ